MRSYSFDIQFDNAYRQHSKKFQIKFNSLKWNYSILIFIIINKLLFSFHLQKISLLINIIIIIYCLNMFFQICQITKDKNTEDDDIFYKRIFLRKLSYSIYFIGISIIDLLIILFFEHEGFISINHFEIYFSYVKLYFVISIISILLFIQFYFRKFFEELNQEIKEKYEI